MTSNNYWDKNFDILKKNRSPIIGWLAEQPFDLKIRLVENRWGTLDWPLPSGKALFDAMPPNTFYESWVPEEKPESSATIIVGCNLGYGVNHVLANTPDSHKVVVMEPRPEMLVSCLSQTDYSQVLDCQRLMFLPPDETAVRQVIFRQLGLYHEFGRIYLRTDIPSRQLGMAYDRWGQFCKEVLLDFRIELNTLRECQDTMVRNELDNFHRAMKSGSISCLENKAQGACAIMMGAGPSLAKFAPLIAENTVDAIYASAFQTLPAIQLFGMKPHFCLAIDHTEVLEKTYDRLDSQWTEDLPLIYSCKVAPKVVSAYTGPSLPIWTAGGLGTHLWKGRELVLDSGRNVGIALMRFLKWCGIRDILLVGFDFGWSGDRTHADGHLASENRFSFDPKRHVRLKNKRGEEIYSAHPLITALRSLEIEIKSSRLNVYNLYGDLATIDGAREVAWDDVLSSEILNSAPGSVEQFLTKLKEKRAPRPQPVFESRSAAWTSSLQAAQKRLEKLFKKTTENRKEIDTALNHLLFFLNQDPLYQPYLITDIRNMAGLIFNKDPYNLHFAL
jgi:hypothetical protein